MTVVRVGDERLAVPALHELLRRAPSGRALTYDVIAVLASHLAVLLDLIVRCVEDAFLARRSPLHEELVREAVMVLAPEAREVHVGERDLETFCERLGGTEEGLEVRQAEEWKHVLVQSGRRNVEQSRAERALAGLDGAKPNRLDQLSHPGRRKLHHLQKRKRGLVRLRT